MNNNLIGEQITKFRKAAGITQEDLGKAAGVSTQAVSRWECGGAPDVSLLPAIADKLGVTIDALFGRELGVPLDIVDQMCRYIASIPEGKRMDFVCRMLHKCLPSFLPIEFESTPVVYTERCTLQNDEGELALIRSVVGLEEGIMLGIGSEELSFMSVFPEPESGWKPYFSDNDDYRKLFDALARPHALEILELLYSEKQHYIAPEVVAERLGIPVAETEELFECLYETHLLYRMETEIVSGMIYTYIINSNGAYVPFMLFARCLTDNDFYFNMRWGDRKGLMLRKPDKKKSDGKKEK